MLLVALAVSSLGLASTSSRMKAVVTDVDGTLFSFAGREISEGNHAALTTCVERGIHVCLATGRIPGPWFEALKERLPGIGPCVFGNGALVVDANGNSIWESSACPVPKPSP